MRRLAALLFLISLVLMLMAIEEPRAVAAWRALDRALTPAVSGLVRRTVEAADRIRSAGPTEAAASGAAPGPQLAGRFDAADADTLVATGEIEFVAAEIRFGRAGLLRTRPHRIALGGDARDASGATLADTPGVAPTDQVELRQVVARGSAALVCDGATPGWAGLFHDGDRVTLMLFRVGPPPGPAASSEALCAVLHYSR